MDVTYLLLQHWLAKNFETTHDADLYPQGINLQDN